MEQKRLKVTIVVAGGGSDCLPKDPTVLVKYPEISKYLTKKILFALDRVAAWVDWDAQPLTIPTRRKVPIRGVTPESI